MEQAGLPTYDELVLVANADALERDADKIRAFIGAVSRGVRDLRANPNESDRWPAGGEPRPRPGAAASGGRRDAAAVRGAEGKPYGWQDPAEWDAFGQWMKEPPAGGPPDVRAAFNNELLPELGAMSSRPGPPTGADAVVLCPAVPGPSSKTWLRCLPQRAQVTSVRIMPCECSWSSTASAITGSVKLGQPEPDSYLVSDQNSSLPQAPQR